MAPPTPDRQPRTLDGITDVRGIRVGHSTDRRAITGCTVVLPDMPVVAGVDVRGGAPGTRETDLMRPGNIVERVHAIVLAGGSAFGLEAATGVMRYLLEHKRGYGFGRVVVPIVPAAILFDLGIGRPDRWPGADAGYRAAASARTRTEQGNVGAGIGATVGKALGPERAMKGGLGTASEQAHNGIVCGALAAVNAAGDVIDPSDGRIIAGARADDGSFADAVEVLRAGKLWRPEAASENTVLVVVATNGALTKEQANRLATVCHDGIARTVRPAHTPGDGDTVFALSTARTAARRRRLSRDRSAGDAGRRAGDRAGGDVSGDARRLSGRARHCACTDASGAATLEIEDGPGAGPATVPATRCRMASTLVTGRVPRTGWCSALARPADAANAAPRPRRVARRALLASGPYAPNATRSEIKRRPSLVDDRLRSSCIDAAINKLVPSA